MEYRLPRLGVRRRLRRYALTADSKVRSAYAQRVRRVAEKARRDNAIVRENRHPGSVAWQMGHGGTRPADDRGMQIKGYASTISAAVGEEISFHATTCGAERFTIEIFRVGHYGGAGARSMAVSPHLHGEIQAPPEIDPETGRIWCDWPPAWSVQVAEDWLSGYYLAVFTTASGWRSYTTFVVRDELRSAALCVVIPFSTYQAYNLWPLDGARGKSLYYGHDPNVTNDDGTHPLSPEHRAREVCFDRPFDKDGLPKLADLDMAYIRWAEAAGYSMVYATSTDLHAGRIDAAKYSGLVFSGHDEYWSAEMRQAVEKAVAGRTALAFLSANNIYWHVRFAPGYKDAADRTVVCYKGSPDPEATAIGATGRWRDPRPNPADPEDRFLGVMYNGILPVSVPLVVANSRHWFWDGTGVKDGQKIPKIVGGEADGLEAPAARRGQALLSKSPFTLRTGEKMVQRTSVIERSRTRGMIFVAGSLHWSRALGETGIGDPRIRQATANVLDRITYNAARRSA